MRRFNILFIFLLLVIAGCKNSNQYDNNVDTFLIVDVKKSYPAKDLILQDFMDVEYIALETSEEFLCQGNILDIGKKFILVRNDSNDGNIFLFDRTGKGIQKINRHGQGSEEYAYMYGVILDESNEEIFINDIMIKRIMVYDLFGNFKRYFESKKGTITNNMYNYDKKYLFCELEINDNKGEQNKSTLALISKQDGSIVNEIEIHYQEKKSTTFVDENNFSLYPYSPIIPTEFSWILTDASSDTVFSFSSKQRMEPLIVRTPLIQTMIPEIFLFPKMITDRYYFMERVKKENGFSRTDWVYDQKEKTIYKYTLCNADYINKQQINTTLWETKNNKVGYWQKINADDLVKAYKQGELQGKLKKVATNLVEDSNPVIMLVKSKKF